MRKDGKTAGAGSSGSGGTRRRDCHGKGNSFAIQLQGREFKTLQGSAHDAPGPGPHGGAFPYHLPLEQVAAGKGEEDPKQQADIPEAMMVFCDLGPGRLDQLLNTMRRTEFPPGAPEGSADSHQPDVGFPPALAGAAPGARGDAGRSGNPVKIH